MADIKQAAKWMQEGKHVRRGKWAPVYFWAEKTLPIIELHTPSGTKQNAMLGIDDLLADDWEIA